MSCQNNIGLLFYDTIHNISRTSRKLNHILPRLLLKELGLNKPRNTQENTTLCEMWFIPPKFEENYTEISEAAHSRDISTNNPNQS